MPIFGKRTGRRALGFYASSVSGIGRNHQSCRGDAMRKVRMRDRACHKHQQHLHLKDESKTEGDSNGCLTHSNSKPATKSSTPHRVRLLFSSETVHLPSNICRAGKHRITGQAMAQNWSKASSSTHVIVPWNIPNMNSSAGLFIRKERPKSVSYVHEVSNRHPMGKAI